MTSCETCGCSVPDLFWHWRSCPACIPDLHWSWEPAPEPAPPVSPTSEAARNEEEEAARLRCHLTKHLGILHLKDKVTMPMLNTFHDLIEGKSDFASALYASWAAEKYGDRVTPGDVEAIRRRCTGTLTCARPFSHRVRTSLAHPALLR